MNEKKLTGFMVFMSVALCISVAISGFTLFSEQKTAKAINQIQGISEDVDREDDVTIGGTYVIKSTLNISDAYKSGDTSKLDDNDKETLDMAKEILNEIIKKDMSFMENILVTGVLKKLFINLKLLEIIESLKQLI